MDVTTEDTAENRTEENRMMSAVLILDPNFLNLLLLKGLNRVPSKFITWNQPQISSSSFSQIVLCKIFPKKSIGMLAIKYLLKI